MTKDRALKSSDHHFHKARLVLWMSIAMTSSFFVWAHFAILDEVAVAEGKVIPSSREQVVQTFSGGILASLAAHEGDVVERGQILAELDPAQARSAAEETETKINTLKVRAARLSAEINDAPEIELPIGIEADSNLVKREEAVFAANRIARDESLSSLQEQIQLMDKELEMVEPLVSIGAATPLEVLRLKQKIAQMSSQLATTRNDYYAKLKSEFSAVMGDLESLIKVGEARSDTLSRTVMRAPARGVVKTVHVRTVGAIVAPGGPFIEIVPLDDKLVVEARISPKDIAFTHQGQTANVKVTAYDPNIYGSLPAKIERISPDTTVDPADPRQVYYKAEIVTEAAFLQTKDGKKHVILPGMVATAEIRTGSKSVLDYIVKPLNRAAEALRER